MALLDLTRSDDRHTSERLLTAPITWLGTTRPDGRPHNVPVWFTWHDPDVLIFTMPDTAKARDIRRFPPVSLALDSADAGQDIVLAEGRAEFAADADPRLAPLADAFGEKYARSLGGTSLQQWRGTFSQALIVHVERIIAWTRTATGIAYRVVP